MVLDQPRGPYGSSLLRMSAQAVGNSLVSHVLGGPPGGHMSSRASPGCRLCTAGSQGPCCGHSVGAGFLGVKGLGSWQGLSDAGGQRGVGWIH